MLLRCRAQQVCPSRQGTNNAETAHANEATYTEISETTFCKNKNKKNIGRPDERYIPGSDRRNVQWTKDLIIAETCWNLDGKDVCTICRGFAYK